MVHLNPKNCDGDEVADEDEDGAKVEAKVEAEAEVEVEVEERRRGDEESLVGRLVSLHLALGLGKS